MTSEVDMKTITIKIPRGIQPGEKIRLLNQGRPGKNGGKDGDFYITMNILPDDKFKICGKDLMMDLPITPWEAVLGTEFYIDAIDSKVLVNVPAGSQTDNEIRIINKGYITKDGSRGDLILKLKIMVPSNMTEQEKTLFLKLNEVSPYIPRKY